MTKAERAELENARAELALAKALRFSNAVEPARMEAPKGHAEYVNGWDTAVYSGIVLRAWSECISNGVGHLKKARTGRDGISGSQGARRLYASELDALIALRIAKERECAKMLAGIDARIEAVRGEKVD